MKSSIVPKRIIMLFAVIILLLTVWIFSVQMQLAIQNDYSAKKDLLSKASLEATVLEKKYLDAHAKFTEESVLNMGYVKEGSPHFVRRSERFGFAESVETSL